MTTSYAARAPRQGAILTAITVLHLGAFVLIASGLGARVTVSLPPDPAITVVFREEESTPAVAPEEILPGEAYFEVVPRPDPSIIPHFDDPAMTVSKADDFHGPESGEEVAVSPVDYRPPTLRTRGSRLASLVNSCYPSGARREGEEGRVTARIRIDDAGRTVAWSVTESSGFPRLDLALDCVIRRLDFIAGRQDGRAVSADALLPIVFRLR